MKITEVIVENNSELANNLVSLLNFLRQRAHDEKVVGNISFAAINNMMKNLGYGLDYFSFKELYDQDPDRFEHLIKSFDSKKITLKPYGDEKDQVDQSDVTNVDEPSLNKVDTMAKRALKRRTD